MMKLKQILIFFLMCAFWPSFLLGEVAPLALVEEGKTHNDQAEEVKPNQANTQIEDPLVVRRKQNQLSRGSARIYSLSMRSNVVYGIQTALGYETTIHLPEPPLMVFVGDRELFKVEVYEHVITLKPITDYEDARTNLTVVTPLSRLAFEITVGPPQSADFALDFREIEPDALVENAFNKRVEEKERVLKEDFAKKEEGLNEKARSLADTKLKEDVLKKIETLKLNEKAEESDIRVELISLSRIGAKSYLKFRVRNQSNTPYKVGKVVVGLETVKRTALGFKQEGEGLIEFESETQVAGEVLQKGYVTGVVIFEGRVASKSERPFFFLFEDGGTRHVKIRGIQWKA